MEIIQIKEWKVQRIREKKEKGDCDYLLNLCHLSFIRSANTLLLIRNAIFIVNRNA
jgi:hypothetical protein